MSHACIALQASFDQATQSQREAIEEDLPEYEDDRGHSAHHPGYRRRQLRFLTMKIFSQVSSFIYFLTVVPVLRFGPNKHRFPFSEISEVLDEPEPELLPEVLLSGEAQQFLGRETFIRAIAFAGASSSSWRWSCCACVGLQLCCVLSHC